jgi:hypothetical protein
VVNWKVARTGENVPDPRRSPAPCNRARNHWRWPT